MVISAILFDKDGTLTDFRATWEGWATALIHDLASVSGIPHPDLGEALGLDVKTATLRPDGPMVTQPFAATLAIMAQTTRWPEADLRQWLARRPLPDPVPACNLADTLGRLSGAGYRLGVLTNDTTQSALRELQVLGIGHLVGEVIGADEGYGSKPDPDGALAFARGQGVGPEEVLLVGDGSSDEGTARAAGMPFIGVLTGTRKAEHFAGARAILPNISYLPSWLQPPR